MKPHPDHVGMSAQIGRDDLGLDPAFVQQGGDLGVGGHGLGQDQLAAAGILQGPGGLPGRRPEVVELVVEGGGQGGAAVDADPEAERARRLVTGEPARAAPARSGPPRSRR